MPAHQQPRGSIALGDLDEAGALKEITARYRAAGVLPPEGGATLGPGDDAAVLPGGSAVVTTDSMVQGLDWRDEWSSPQDVGAKLTASNLADLAAMGARAAGVVVSLHAHPRIELEWVLGLADGIAARLSQAGALMLGGDLSGAAPGQVVVAMTALGHLDSRAPVRRSGALDGDVVAVCGTLGTSGAGLALLATGWTPNADSAGDAAGALVRSHLAPRPPLAGGVAAARAGAHAMIDISDSLLMDAWRLARASGVALDLDGAALDTFSPPLVEAGLDVASARDLVLTGGEEHSLLATFEPGVDLSEVGDGPWRAIGRVSAAQEPGVRIDAEPVAPRGWDHFSGPTPGTP